MPRKPKAGDLVEVRWLDSGADVRGSPTERHSLSISHTWGKVLTVGECGRLKKALPRGWDSTILVIAHCSAGDDDEGSHIGIVWWRSVVECNILRRKK